MSDRLSYEVLPGGLSDDDRARICDYAERGWRPTRIASHLRKHPSTVYWFMLTQGLVAPTRRQFRPYLRNGRLVAPFSAEEDAFITALRVQDYAFREIARISNARFGTTRTPHAVMVRLVMLANAEEAA